MTPNEVRFRYYELGPVKGGETPFMQQQDWPLALLADRTAADLMTTPSAQNALPPVAPEDDDMADDDAEKALLAVLRKSLEIAA